MKTITKFIYLGFASLALAYSSIAFAQIPITPLIPPDSAAKAAALLPPSGEPINQTVAFESGSRWHLTVNAMDGFGLVITGASFQKSPTSPYIYVLFDGRLGEIFVPYHSGFPRYVDLQYNFSCLRLNPADFPPPRQIIGDSRKICKEVREYLAWMDAYHSPTRVRYGKEVVY